MGKENQYEAEIKNFVGQLYSKGYRGRFLLDKTTSSRLMTAGDLKSCLETFLDLYESSRHRNNLLQLETNVPYDDDLRCIFNVAFNELEGFKIRKMEIVNGRK